MVRILVFLVAVTLAAVGVARFADTPGSLTVTWLGYEVQTSVLFAALLLALCLFAALLLWAAIRYIATRPAALSRYVHDRQEERGLEALSMGLIAVGAGDKEQARKYAGLAQKRLPGEPLTGLLRAQAAQLGGDRAEARRIFQAMAGEPKTELLGLRGLFLEARREDELEAARQFADRAMNRNPDLSWSVTALFELHCRAGDWDGALKTLAVARRQKQIDREVADRRRAVLLTAQAIEAEEEDIDRARELALEANKLAPGLVPAAELAGRLLVSQGSMSRAGRLIAKAWEISPHPDLALAYAYLRPGDSPRDRLQRVVSLVQSAPDHSEGLIAIAAAAVEARAWREAREALDPLIGKNPSARVCTLMARIEGGERGDQGRVREWLARAVRAPRDPVWTADGYTSSRWAPVSPVTGALDAFEWKMPVESIGPADTGSLAYAEAEAAFAQGTPEALPAAATVPGEETARAAETPGEDVVVIEAAPASRDAAPDKEISAVERPGPEPGHDGAPESKLSPAPDTQPHIFVPPHAPDDPGPGSAEDAFEGGEQTPPGQKA